MIAFALALTAADFDTLDGAIDKCDRDTVMPIFAGEAERRSAFATVAYNDQMAISVERASVADRRRVIREAGGRSLPKLIDDEKPLSDQQLSLMNLALDDRQRALDDHRRLETMREEGVDLKRRYFLSHCTPTKGDIK